MSPRLLRYLQHKSFKPIKKNICKYLQSQAVMCLSYLSVILHTSLFRPNRAVEHQHHHHHSHKSNQNQGQHQNHHPYPHPYRHPHPHRHQHCHHPILIIHPPPPHYHHHYHHHRHHPYPHQHRQHRHYRHDYTITITMTMTTTIMASLTIVALSTQPVLLVTSRNAKNLATYCFSDSNTWLFQPTLVQSSTYTTYKRQHIRVTPPGIPNVFFRSLSVFFRQVSRRRRCFRWQRQRRWVCWRWRRCHASHADCSSRSRLKTIEAAVASIAWKNKLYESLKTNTW